MNPILDPLEREIYKLSVAPSLNKQARALVMSAGALQCGATTLEGVIDRLKNPDFEGINMPTEDGKVAGIQMVEFLGTTEECCDSCAYRPGTVPNQCPGTIIDALKCAVGGEAFYCHKTGLVCEGWKATQKRKTE